MVASALLRVRALAALTFLWLSACGASAVGFEFDESETVVCAVGTQIVPPDPGSMYHGVFPGGVTGEEDDLTPEDLASYEAAVGRRASWVYFSHNWYRDRTFPLVTASWIRDQGSVPFIRLMLRSGPRQNVSEPLFTHQAILEGDFDADLAAWGRAAAEFGTPVIVEWGTEANGRWFAWNGTWYGGGTRGPALFRAAYRHIVRTICAEGASNLTWVFHVNGTDVPGASWNRFEHYYPGDDVVDWVGVSAYGALTPMDPNWPSLADRLDEPVRRLEALVPDKPLFLLEFGVTAGNPRGDPAQWADEALSELLSGRWPSVRGFSWWNETWRNDANPANDTNMRVQDIAGAEGVFRAHLASPVVVDRPILASGR